MHCLWGNLFAWTGVEKIVFIIKPLTDNVSLLSAYRRSDPYAYIYNYIYITLYNNIYTYTCMCIYIKYIFIDHSHNRIFIIIICSL